ncbi:uncharacterized protein LOC18443330 isoform X4 [Amborella trichopoda]|uniref:uncharacterized protein LOC18443330 isoform X4 n=1 Tax=Amborella trichopoda TaxID=13333 RepID=UPI0005D40707|nr:uncharacterized protein LOC18443330 isoform X4 [Amborella trichopoda]|eukprot:XP_011626704.1 uncharacterized protein LOC18443330 isoform X4 [Amborella trichopoda]
MASCIGIFMCFWSFVTDNPEEIPSGTQQTGAAPEPDVEAPNISMQTQHETSPETTNNGPRKTQDPPDSSSKSNNDGDSEHKCKDAISIATAFGSGSFLRAVTLLSTNTKTRVYALGALVVIYFAIFVTATEMLYLIFLVPCSTKAMDAIKFMIQFLLFLLVVVLLIEFYAHLPDQMLWTVGLACVVVLLSGVAMHYLNTWVSA